MFDAILLPTDGSRDAEKAAPYAARLAATFDATLYVMYVVDVDAVSLSLGAEQLDRLETGRFAEMTEVHERAAGAIDRVRDVASREGMAIEPVIEVGVPHKAIVEFAEEGGVDLIVMTSHGRGGVKRALLGSVTERVARGTRVPVLVVDANGEPLDTGTAGLEGEAV